MRVLYARKFKVRITDDRKRVSRRDFTEVCEYPSKDREEIYMYMQADFMSSERLQRLKGLIDRGVTDHTSMSVGDVVIDDKGHAWICGMAGWREVTLSYTCQEET